jgi:hypothetical protein
MIANVRRRAASMETSDMAKARGRAQAGAGGPAIIRAVRIRALIVRLPPCVPSECAARRTSAIAY